MNKRFKLTLIALGLGLFQALLKTMFSAFPLVELFAFQGGIIAGYYGMQTLSDIKESKYGNNRLV